MKIDNLASYDIVLKWTEGNDQKTKVVKSLVTETYHTMLQSFEKPQDIVVRGYKLATQERILLNQEIEIRVKPSLRQKLLYILIESTGKNSLIPTLS